MGDKSKRKSGAASSISERIPHTVSEEAQLELDADPRLLSELRGAKGSNGKGVETTLGEVFTQSKSVMKYKSEVDVVDEEEEVAGMFGVDNDKIVADEEEDMFLDRGQMASDASRNVDRSTGLGAHDE